MANQLTMDKSFAINNLRSAGYSERRIAQTLADLLLDQWLSANPQAKLVDHGNR